METLGRHRKSLALAKAIAFYRRNPQSTIPEVAAACGVSRRLVWQARQEMVTEGVCKPNKRAGKSLTAPNPPPQLIPPSPPVSTLLDGEQLARLAAGDTTPVDETDPETRLRMLNELRSIAFNPATYVDTRVTAMKAWFALKDVVSAKDLGPGRPKTFEDAVTRLSNILIACGTAISIEAMERAFVRKGTGDAPTKDNETTVAVGPQETTLSTGHSGETSETPDLRSEFLG
jgi:hypothetical protein